MIDLLTELFIATLFCALSVVIIAFASWIVVGLLIKVIDTCRDIRRRIKY